MKIIVKFIMFLIKVFKVEIFCTGWKDHIGEENDNFSISKIEKVRYIMDTNASFLFMTKKDIKDLRKKYNEFINSPVDERADIVWEHLYDLSHEYSMEEAINMPYILTKKEEKYANQNKIDTYIFNAKKVYELFLTNKTKTGIWLKIHIY